MKIDSSKNIFSNNNVIRKRHIEKVVAKMMRIPSSTIGNNSKSRLVHLKGKMQENLFGQDHAIDKVVSAIKISQVGLKNENKPIGSFLFAGPTGVGKTEFCIQLAKQLNLELIRFDMSEYMEKHSVSKLVRLL